MNYGFWVLNDGLCILIKKKLPFRCLELPFAPVWAFLLSLI